MSFEIICIYLFVFSIFTKILSKIYKENLTNKNILMVSIIFILLTRKYCF